MGRDTLSDEHLVGTAAGVMRSRAVRRLEEPVGWVPQASQVMLFAPWAPHLNLSGCPRLQKPAYEVYERLCEGHGFTTTMHSEIETFRMSAMNQEQARDAISRAQHTTSKDNVDLEPGT